MPLTEADLVGGADEDTYMKQRDARFKRGEKWISHEYTSLRCTVAVTVISAEVAEMGKYFHEAKFNLRRRRGLDVFCNADTSPAVRLVKQYLYYLDNPDDDFWLPIRAFGRLE